MRNIDKYLSILNDEVDGLLLTSRYSRHYGAEFDISEGVAVVSKAGCRYFTDSRYIESAQRDLKYFEVLPINQFTGFIKRINDAIADFGITTLGYEEAYLTAGELMEYQEKLNAKLVPYNAKIAGFRGSKEPWELELMKKAQAITDKAGVIGKDVDMVARKVITDAGYGEYFGHGYGHSLGLEIHEAPNVNPGNPNPMPVGAVCSAEPGIYLPGKFGVRIEDVTVITEDGTINITASPKNLIIV